MVFQKARYVTQTEIKPVPGRLNQRKERLAAKWSFLEDCKISYALSSVTSLFLPKSLQGKK